MTKLSILVALLGCAACRHTREVEQGGPEADQKQPEPAAQGPGKRKPSSPEARPPVEPGRPELSVSPAALLRPDGPRLIQQALARRGYLPGDHLTDQLDKETSGALRRFQADQGLAKTGAPDRLTVRRLGLSVGKVFRSTNDRPPDV